MSNPEAPADFTSLMGRVENICGALLPDEAHSVIAEYVRSKMAHGSPASPAAPAAEPKQWNYRIEVEASYCFDVIMDEQSTDAVVGAAAQAVLEKFFDDDDGVDIDWGPDGGRLYGSRGKGHGPYLMEVQEENPE